jgi:hypothetical protein
MADMPPIAENSCSVKIAYKNLSELAKAIGISINQSEVHHGYNESLPRIQI